MSDPFNPKSLLAASIWTQSLNFNEHVYPGANTKSMFEAIKTGNPIIAPSAIFIPTRQVFRVMIRAVLKYGHEEENKIFMRFGIVELKAKVNNTFITEFKQKGQLSRMLRAKVLSELKR